MLSKKMTPPVQRDSTSLISVAWRVVVYFVFVLLAVPFFRVEDRVSHGSVLAQMTAAVLRVVGTSVTCTHDVLAGSGFAMQIAPVCDGADLIVILGLAIVLSPAPWRVRLWGLVAALLLTQLLNLGRLACMFLIGVHLPEYFDLFHHVLWQAIAIAFCVALYAVWLSYTPIGSRDA